MLPYAFNKLGISSGGGIPTQGLVYYAPLTSKKSTDELGNNLTFQEVGLNWNFGVIDGIPCAYSNYTAGFGKGAWIYSSTPLWTSKPTPANMHYTMSWWMRRGAGDNGQAMFDLGYGSNTVSYDFIQAKGTGTEGLVLWRRLIVQLGNLIATPTTYPHESWLYCTLVWEGEQTKMYVNGVLIGTESTAYASLNQSGNMLWALGFWLNQSPAITTAPAYDYNKNSAYSALRIYNRVLSQNEINTLKNEFNPTN